MTSLEKHLDNLDYGLSQIDNYSGYYLNVKHKGDYQILVFISDGNDDNDKMIQSKHHDTVRKCVEELLELQKSETE